MTPDAIHDMAEPARAVHPGLEARQSFAALTDDAPDAIARVGCEGRIRYANRKLASLFQRQPGDLLGATIVSLGLPRRIQVWYRRAVRETFEGAAETGFTFDLPLDGNERYFIARIVPEFSYGEERTSVLVITCDVTEKVKIERQRDVLLLQEQAARSKAETATRARDQFLSIISHELRSPLNGIQSWSHVLENQLSGPDRANPVALRALEGIRAGIDQQVRLIEHLIDATISMTGTLQIVEEVLVLREPIEAALAEVRSSAIGKDLALYVDMRLTNERMHGDAHRVQQIFGHLLSNALKFTPQGGSIWVSAHRHEAGAVVTVRDSGRGLASGYERWLFEAFSHADSSNTRRSGGIGLGLALARRLVEAHGGRIEANSAGPHLGSTFTVELPLEERRQVPRESPTGVKRTQVRALEGLSALVVDDQLEAREALSALLTQFGAHIDVAASSRAGVMSIEQRGTLPDVVICDIAMPEEDGYGFVKRLRTFEESHGALLAARGGPGLMHTPIVALSAFAATDRHRDTGPDFDAYLTKPVDPPQLLATLYRLVISARRRAIPAP